MTAPIRIANCSGFFGDRPSGAVEMVEGGHIDVLTGDWLAELTMLILAKGRAKRPGGGYAGTFVQQMEQVMGSCLERGIKVVSNAGGLDPAGCAEAVAEVAARLGLQPRIAHITGDDLMERVVGMAEEGILMPFPGPQGLGDPTRYLTANAYLGCWGIVEALGQGADIVIAGRVTDAALTCGPAAWHHGWTPDDHDQLAGAVVAGHLIECSAQVTGGNYSFLAEEWPEQQPVRLGFPWVDVAADGSCVVGKHEGTGGVVSRGTVTSQLLYEIAGPRYDGPDVTARFDTIALEDLGGDRVRVSGVLGEPPPPTLKVAVNESGGFRNTVAVALTGLDIEAKAAFAKAAFWDACPYRPEDFDRVETRIEMTAHDDPCTQARASALLVITAFDRDERKVGRAFSNAAYQTALSSVAGIYLPGDGPSGASAFGVYRPALVPADEVVQLVHGADGHPVEVRRPAPARTSEQPDGTDAPDDTTTTSWAEGPTATSRVALGRIVGTRSGDKGGHANLGVFARSQQAYPWLAHFLTEDRLRELLPETASLVIRRYEFPNLASLNFVIEGFLGDGVASCARSDRQAKALGEWLRARIVEVPAELVPAH